MRIVVFGAGGCVGGWICEKLALRGDIDLVPCVRSWASAQRLARRGVVVQQVDLESADFPHQLLVGADAVINAATLAPAREAELVARIYSACVEAKVRRFVQFSSAVVYGKQTGDIGESAPLQPTDDYSAGKVNMERRLLKAALAAPAGSPQVFVLRPSIVYGPFAELWTIHYARRIAKGRWRSLGRAGAGTCNVVHVDDLAQAAILAASAEAAAGSHVLNVNGPEVVSWNEYIDRFGEALGVAERTMPNYILFDGATRAANFVRTVGAWAKKIGLYSLIAARPVSQDVKSFASLYPYSEEMNLLRRKVLYSADLISKVLDYHPAMSLSDGLRQSADWCRVHGVM